MPSPGSRKPYRNPTPEHQADLFPTQVHLHRIAPERNEWRFYALSIQPDLFGGAALVRRWGRIGTSGSSRLDLFPDAGAAASALATQLRRRLKRRYRPVGL